MVLAFPILADYASTAGRGGGWCMSHTDIISTRKHRLRCVRAMCCCTDIRILAWGAVWQENLYRTQVQYPSKKYYTWLCTRKRRFTWKTLSGEPYLRLHYKKADSSQLSTSLLNVGCLQTASLVVRNPVRTYPACGSVRPLDEEERKPFHRNRSILSQPSSSGEAPMDAGQELLYGCNWVTSPISPLLMWATSPS